MAFVRAAKEDTLDDDGRQKAEALLGQIERDSFTFT
jgi:hypothetical protein